MLKRDENNVRLEHFSDFEAMRTNEKVLEDLNRTDRMRAVATCLLKNNNYWIFHKPEIEDSATEKAHPAEKLWLILREMSADPDYEFEEGLGLKLSIGDTVKFGRVRYKVVEMHTGTEGLQSFMVTDRLQKERFNSYLKQLRSAKRKKSKLTSQASGISSVRSNSRMVTGTGVDLVNQPPGGVDLLPRYQSQVT
jgi:hypothetical protein